MRFFQDNRALTMSACAIVCALFSTAAHAQTSFSAHALYNTTNAQWVLAHGDFNNDGREDLIVQEISGSTSTNVLLLSNGDGTYDAPIKLPTSASAGRLVVGDFNHDGKLDFAAFSSGQVAIYLGNGDGTFSGGHSVAASSGLLALVAADLNHDSKTDLILVSGSGTSGDIQVWLSDGTGGFSAGQHITSGVLMPSYAGTGDFDGDGKADLVIDYEPEGQATSVQVWYGNGTGSLGNAVQATDSSGPQDNWDPNGVGDVDGNGTSDLVMSRSQYGPSGTSTNYQQIEIVKGNTNRTLSLTTVSTANGCPEIHQIQVADVNGDGLNDLVYGEAPCSGSGTTNVVVNPATSKGVFSGSEQVVYSTSNEVYGPLDIVKSTQGTKPDMVLTPFTGPFTNGLPPTAVVLLQNSSSGSFPKCGTTNQGEGVHVCVPSGTSASSPVQFSISASGPTPMRTVAVWSDGVKVAQQLTHAFSNYSFLDQSIALSAGTHSITIYGTGWDNTLQKKSFTLSVGGTTSTCSAPTSAGVHVCSPVNGSSVSSPVKATATATITGTLARMEVWADGVKKYSETTSKSLSTSIALGAGKHQFDFYAVNTAGTKWKTTVFATVP